MKDQQKHQRTGFLILGERLRTSLWLIPGLLTVSAISLSFLTLYLDRLWSPDTSRLPFWIFGGGAEGARGVLTTVGQSMLTIAGIVFSITIVVLSLASNQFGPRILRNFLKDRVNHTVLGCFTAIYLYCLLILRSVHDSVENQFIPHISVTLSIVLAIVGIGMLTYFIHHIGLSVQPSFILSEIATEVRELTNKLFSGDETLSSNGNQRLQSKEQWIPVVAPDSGYLETVEYDELADLLKNNNAVFHSEVVVGQFVKFEQRLGWLMGAVENVDPAKLSSYFYIGDQRTGTEDLDFLLSQLTEMVVRALSPGINDPFTAMSALDRLEEAFCTLALKPLQMSNVALKHSNCILMRCRAFNELLESAFGLITVHAARHPKVALHYDRVLIEISNFCLVPERKAAVALQRQRLIEAAEAQALPGSAALQLKERVAN